MAPLFGLLERTPQNITEVIQFLISLNINYTLNTTCNTAYELAVLMTAELSRNTFYAAKFKSTEGSDLHIIMIPDGQIKVCYFNLSEYNGEIVN